MGNLWVQAIDPFVFITTGDDEATLIDTTDELCK